MAFFLSPRFEAAYAPRCHSYAQAGPSRRRSPCASRSSAPFLAPFLSQMDELFGELGGDTRRDDEQRQQRSRLVHARFDVHERDGGYQVDGAIPGFERSDLDIEVTDDHALKIVGNTEKRSSQALLPAPETVEAQAQHDATEGSSASEPAGTFISDTESQPSHHATVEDEFEDIGAETTQAASADAAGHKENSSEEKSHDEAGPAATQIQALARPSSSVTEDRFTGSFERTFRFPERIDASAITASLKNGLLNVKIPKAKAPQVKKVLIQ